MRQWGTLVLAAAMLSLETALTRVFALAQGYHFAFMAISIALLGMGAGGTFLTLWLPARNARQTDRHLAVAAMGFAATTLASYLLVNRFPFDPYRIAWERAQVGYLVVNYVVLATPFFFSGLAFGLALARTERSHVTYAANLIGSAVGCLVALVALSVLGGAGTIALSAAMGSMAAACFARSSPAGRPGEALFGACVLGTTAALALAWLRPSWLEIRLSPYRPQSYALQYPDARVLSSRWNSFSRVDVVESSAIHVSPGLSLGYDGEIPRQRGLYTDAHAQAAIVDALPVSVEQWADALPVALAYRLRPQANVLALEPGGALDVVVARSMGAQRITTVSSNPLVVDAVRRYGHGLYDDPGVHVVIQSPRSLVRSLQSRGQSRFQVIDLALTDAQQTVVSGAYALGEDYVHTVQAYSDYLGLLEPGGLLVVHRWLQTPPSESLRAWALAVEAVERDGGPPTERLVAIRSWSTMLILVKAGRFTAAELEIVRQFCAERQFDLVYLPDLDPTEVNRNNVYPGAPYYAAFGQVISPESRETFYDTYPYDIRPPTDDRPYFHHFFRWRQVPEMWQALGHTWQPFGGGGYLVLVAMLAIATLASALLVVFPLAFLRRASEQARPVPQGMILAYFSCLGIAYLAVEIPLIQRFVLFVDHPTIAFVAVLAVLLVSSGVGSLLAPSLGRWAILALILYLVLLLALLPIALEALLGYSLPMRVTAGCLLLAPLGLLMGVPFPMGIAALHRIAPRLIPWAWGVNGCASVIASVLTTLIALEWGFVAVLGLAAVCYVVAWAILRRIRAATESWV